MDLPHCTSCSLFEYQMVMGPCAFMASLEPPPLEPHAARVPAMTPAVRSETASRRHSFRVLSHGVPFGMGISVQRCGRRRGGGAHHQPGRGQGDVGRFAVLHQPQQCGGGGDAPTGRVVVEGGEGRVDERPDLGSVEPGDRELARKVEPAFVCDAHPGDRHRVVPVDDGGGAVLCVEQVFGGLGALLGREVGGDDRVGVIPAACVARSKRSRRRSPCSIRSSPETWAMRRCPSPTRCATRSSMPES